MPEITKTLYVKDARQWRDWLERNYKTEKEIWLILPHVGSGKQKIVYNDSVEEALCFAWIDSTVKSFDKNASVQRFTPRRTGSPYSQMNKERIKLLAREGKIVPEVLASVQDFVNEEYIYPKDILSVIQANADAWSKFQTFSDAYKRIRVAYIQESRSNPQEFAKKLQNFINKTARGVQFDYGGIKKYF